MIGAHKERKDMAANGFPSLLAALQLSILCLFLQADLNIMSYSGIRRATIPGRKSPHTYRPWRAVVSLSLLLPFIARKTLNLPRRYNHFISDFVILCFFLHYVEGSRLYLRPTVSYLFWNLV